MANSDFLITISSPTLSLLYYENVRNCGNQIGFLLGESLEFITKTYTDGDNQKETVHRCNNIQAIITCPLRECLYDSVGRINKERLQELLKDRSKEVIGWFHYRRNMNLTLTFRDTILHKQFASYFSTYNGLKEEFFIACLLNSSTSKDGGTHKFKHVFFRRRISAFEPVSSKITNLGNDSFVHEGSNYKLTPSTKTSNVPDVFSSLMQSLNLDLRTMSEVQCADTIQKRAEQYFNELIPKLCQSDLEVQELEKKIKELKLKKLRRIESNKNQLHEGCNVQESKNDKKVDTFERIPTSEVESGKLNYSESSDDDNFFSSPRKEESVKSHQTANIFPETSLTCKTIQSEKDGNVSNPTRNDINTIDSPNRRPPSGNPVTKMHTQIGRESICKDMEHFTGNGRGRGTINISNIGKHSMYSSSSGATPGSGNESLGTRVPQEASSQGNGIQNTSITQSSNSEKTKKRGGRRK